MDEYIGGTPSAEESNMILSHDVDDGEFDFSSTPCSIDRVEDWDEEEIEETEEDSHIRSEANDIMKDLWDPKGDEEVAEALRKLLSLAQDRASNQKLIRIAGAIPLLVDMIKSAENLPQLSPAQALTVDCMAVLSKNVLNRVEIGVNGGLAPLVSCLHFEEQRYLVEILQCLHECSKTPPKNRVLLRNAGFLEALLSHLTPENEPVQCLILDILRLYIDEESQKILQYANGIPLLIQLIGNGTQKVRSCAMRTLGILCGNNIRTNSLLHKTKAIETITSQLSSADEEVQKAAAESLSTLTLNDFKNQSVARQAGAVSLLVPLLSSKSNSVKKSACLAIRSLARSNVKVQSEFRDSGALKTLVGLMASPSDGVAINATSALIELSNNSNRNAEEICYGGGATLLVSLLQRDNPPLQYQAEGAIWAIVRKSSACREEFVKVGASQSLRNLANHPNEQVKRGASWALDALEK